MRVLVIDNFDSFTYNLLELFELEGCELDVHFNSVSPDDVDITKYDLLMLSPGPSTPENAGFLLEYIRRFKGQIPIFGVCLGFQSLILDAGGKLDYLGIPVHGKISTIDTIDGVLFNDMPSRIDVGRYHSIYGETVPDEFVITAKTDDGLPMAIEHKTLPLYGVQFHPESILTMKANTGRKIISNILKKLAK